MADPVCPVCGMTVKDKDAPTSTYEKKQYAFCSDECKEEFDRNPKGYAEAAEKVSKSR